MSSKGAITNSRSPGDQIAMAAAAIGEEGSNKDYLVRAVSACRGRPKPIECEGLTDLLAAVAQKQATNDIAGITELKQQVLTHI